MRPPRAGRGPLSEEKDRQVNCPNCGSENDPLLDLCFSCGSALSDLGPGSVIASRFELIVEVGKGGMGRIFRAHDRILDEDVGIKVLRPELVASKDMKLRFRKEIRLARKVSHPNVCCIFDYGEDGDIHYISMEFIEGVDLKKTLVLRKKGLDTGEAFAAALGISAGLEAIHDEGIIHRDLKTQNIMIDGDGVVRLMDFGIAKDADQQPGEGLTRVGTIIGTPEYMSPEQCRATTTLDRRSDIYSLGVVCYEIFTGTVPLRGESPMDTMMLQIEEEPAFQRALGQGLPVAMVEPLRKALQKNPDARFQTVADFMRALEGAREDTTAEFAERVSTEPESERRRDRRLDIHVNCWIRVVGEGNAIVEQEQTIAENISRGGVRVMTSLSHLSVGDRVVFEEIGGPFRTRAEVRGNHMGPDHIQRLHLKFIDHAGPDHLVGSGRGTMPSGSGQ